MGDAVFGVYEFPWGAAVKNEETQEWTNVISSDGNMIVVAGLDVDLDENGVIFERW